MDKIPKLNIDLMYSGLPSIPEPTDEELLKWFPEWRRIASARYHVPEGYLPWAVQKSNARILYSLRRYGNPKMALEMMLKFHRWDRYFPFSAAQALVQAANGNRDPLVREANLVLDGMIGTRRMSILDPLAAFAMPFTVVSPGIVEALMHSTPPTEIFDDIFEKMGFPAMTFLLPKGYLVDTSVPGESGDCRAISIHYVDSEIPYNGIFTGSWSDVKKILTAPTFMDGIPRTIAATVMFSFGGSFHMNLVYRSPTIPGKLELLEIENDGALGESESRRKEFQRRGLELAAQLLHLWNSNPEMITFVDKGGKVHSSEPEASINERKPKPRMCRHLGYGYKTMTERGKCAANSDSCGLKSPHWRKGFQRRQHFGPKNSQIKYVTIFPVWVESKRWKEAQKEEEAVQILPGSMGISSPMVSM